MIRYSNGLWGLWSLTQWWGSAVPRVLAPACIAAGASAVLRHWIGERLTEAIPVFYPFGTFLILVGLALVFRCFFVRYLVPRSWRAAARCCRARGTGCMACAACCVPRRGCMAGSVHQQLRVPQFRIGAACYVPAHWSFAPATWPAAGLATAPLHLGPEHPPGRSRYQQLR
jgi:hypothetical protein